MQALTDTLYLAEEIILTVHTLLAMLCCNPGLAGRGKWHDVFGRQFGNINQEL